MSANRPGKGEPAKLPEPMEVEYDDFLHELAAQASGNPDPNNPQTRGLHRLMVNVWNQAHDGLLKDVQSQCAASEIAKPFLVRIVEGRKLPPVN